MLAFVNPARQNKIATWRIARFILRFMIFNQIIRNICGSIRFLAEIDSFIAALSNCKQSKIDMEGQLALSVFLRLMFETFDPLPKSRIICIRRLQTSLQLITYYDRLGLNITPPTSFIF